jgi:hypothetical protein
MAIRFMSLLLRHRAIVTLTLVAVLLLNLSVVGMVAPPDSLDGDLPNAARCQGGGPGCAEQPLIPPPVGGLPHFEPPAPAVFNEPAPVFGAPLAAVIESPPPPIEQPPSLLRA